MEIPYPLLPPFKSIFDAKDIVDKVLVFLKTDNELLVFPLAVAISGFPSPSRSPASIQNGEDAVAKSVLAAKEKLPLVLLFLKIDTLLLEEFTAAISGFPSPLKSLIVAA